SAAAVPAVALVLPPAGVVAFALAGLAHGSGFAAAASGPLWRAWLSGPVEHRLRAIPDRGRRADGGPDRRSDLLRRPDPSAIQDRACRGDGRRHLRDSGPAADVRARPRA